MNRPSFEASTNASSSRQSWRRYPVFPPRDWYNVENRIYYIPALEEGFKNQAYSIFDEKTKDLDSDAIQEFKRTKYSLLSAEPHLQISHIRRDEERHVFDLKLNMGVYPDQVLDESMLEPNRPNPWIHPADIEDPRFHEKLGFQKISLAMQTDRQIGSSRSIKTQKSSSLLDDTDQKSTKAIDLIQQCNDARRLLEDDAGKVCSKLKIDFCTLVKCLKQEKFGQSITRDEFRKLLSSLDIKVNLFESDSAFKLLDSDSDGLISAEDLADVLTGSRASLDSRIYTTKLSEKIQEPLTWTSLSTDLRNVLTRYLRQSVCVGQIIINLRALLLTHSTFFNLPILSESEIRHKLMLTASLAGRHLDSPSLVYVSKHIR